MRSGVAALAAGCAIALAVLAVVAAGDRRERSFGPNVRAERVLAVATPAREICQSDVGVAADFDTVELLLGTYGRPGPPLAVRVRDTRSGGQLAAGTLPAGAADNRAARVRVEPEVERGGSVDVCVRTAARRVALYGGADSDVITEARAGGRRVDGDLWIAFGRSEPRSALALLPDMLRRASVFRPEPVGPWAFWVLLAGVVAGVPLLLAGALRRAAGGTAAKRANSR
ncbi:MAG TPA: hypothetical protein VF517_03310 [Thermoleophilaceae bacterium]|jgi:hypothetical protein